MVYAHPRIRSGEWDALSFLGFWNKVDHLISVKRPDLVIIDKNKNKNKNKKQTYKKLPFSGLCRPGRSLSKIERKQKER